MMKLFIIASLSILCFTMTVTQSSICTCAQILNATDCQNLDGCAWSNSKCATASTTDTSASVAVSPCTSITLAATCAGQDGCAYANSKCGLFSGCQSYAGETNAACQAFSKQCNYNGVTCAAGDTCSAQQNEADCTSVLQTNGSKFCKWDSANTTCASLTCTDAAATNTTDELCEQFLLGKGCKTNKVGCVSTFVDCTQLTTAQCTTALAKDSSGNVQTCSLNLAGTACAVKSCDTAPTSNTTDAACETYLAGCKTTGKGCVTTLLACATYSGDNSTCAGRVGSDGKCTGVANGTNCSAILCSSNTDATTDAACANVQANCKSTGKGCVDALPSCTTYQVSDLACASRKGSEGPCKQAQTTDTNCSASTCADATTKSATGCPAFMTGCLFNGTTCVNPLPSCTTYTGTTDTCATKIGSEGTCVGVDATEQACKARECTGAPATNTTNELCNTYRAGCVTTGKGCITALSTCSSYTGSTTTCVGYVGTDGNCEGVDTTDQACKAKVCTNAPTTTNTDDACAAYQKDCVTTGKGCIAKPLVQCSQFQGTITECDGLKGSDGNCKGLDASTKQGCTLKVCSDNTTSTTDADCQKVQSNCALNLLTQKGCVIKKTACTDYTTKDECNANISTSGVCFWGTDAQCRNAVCSDATGFTSIDATTDTGCAKLISTCKSDGKLCYDPNNYACTDISIGEKCTLDSNKKGCLWMVSAKKCVSYSQCSDLKLQSTTECQKINTLCQTDGTNCVPMQLCKSYYEQTKCTIGSDGDCGWLNNKCQLFTKCSDGTGTTTAECSTFNSKCVSNGTTCIEKAKCATYTTQVGCQSTGTDGKCFWDTAASTCKLMTCADATTEVDITTNAGCSALGLATSCTTNGTTCVDIAKCSTYTVEAGCVTGTDGSCIWENSACRLKVCTDQQLNTKAACETVGCAFDTAAPTTCIDKKKCASYSQTQCDNASSDEKETCLLKSDNTCIAFSTCADANSDQTICEANDCVYADSKCAAKTCATNMLGTDCQPLLQSDKTSYTVCVPTTDKTSCQEGDETALTAETCFLYSAKTYTWNITGTVCQKCGSSSSNTTDSNSTDTGNNTTGGSTTKYGVYLSELIALWLIAQ